MEQRVPAIFVAGSRGLDFLNSVATPLHTRVDWIADGAGLLAWLAEAELVPREILEGVRRQVGPGELDKVAAEARSLREWFRAFVERHRGKTLEARALRELEPLNRLLERDEAFAQITPCRRGGEQALELRAVRRWRTPESLLAPIAEALAHLVTSEDFSQVKRCEGAACTLLFADHTRSKARRWCSMAICGNRAKQAAHRQRLRGGASAI